MAISIPEVQVVGEPRKRSIIVVDPTVKARIMNELATYITTAAGDWNSCCQQAYDRALTFGQFESEREKTYAAMGTASDFVWSLTAFGGKEAYLVGRTLKGIAKLILFTAKESDLQIKADEQKNDLLKTSRFKIFAVLNQTADQLRTNAATIAVDVFDELLYFTDAELAGDEMVKIGGTYTFYSRAKDARKPYSLLTIDDDPGTSAQNTIDRQAIAWEYLFKCPYAHQSEGLNALVFSAITQLIDVLKQLSEEYVCTELHQTFHADWEITTCRTPGVPFPEWVKDKPSYAAVVKRIQEINYASLSQRPEE